ncbi:FIST signal transduction protein [Aeromonas simiae]|uniref:FIST signal transduction protein n=1 Tax=Aeromonas simiae TaxID=218936 RepID=UPI0005AB4080|nr:FIST N-terminal domain-containing protein [Aeromonas simiae]
MKFITAQSHCASTADAAQEIISDLLEHTASLPSLLLVYFSALHSSEILQNRLSLAFPDVPMLGCSSCRAVQTGQDEGAPVAVAAFYDSRGAYGVAGSMEPDAHQLLKEAMRRCDRPGELPHMVLLHASPGLEETLLAQIDAELGHSVPVIGGSAADEAVQGQWQLCWSDGAMGEGAALAVLYPDCELAFQFHSGYMPTRNHAVVTEAEGREVISLDGRPAADLYQEWLGISLPNGPILRETTLAPLARVVGAMYEVPYYKLSHPESITKRRGLRLFTRIEQGETLWLMQGSAEGLLQRSLLAARVEPAYGMPSSLEPFGALVVFCAGCRLALSERLDELSLQFRQRLGGIPYVMPFTFGEQGRLPQGEITHGNLMISSVIFCSGERLNDQ